MSNAPPNHDTTSTRSSSYLSWLPLELRCRTVSFLHPSDALSFSQHLGSREFGVTVSRLEPPHRIFASARWTGLHGDGQPVCSNYRLPVLPGGPVQSAVLSFRWSDQGDGERHGKLYIVASSSNSNSNNDNTTTNNMNNNGDDGDDDAVPSLPFGGGRVVCETELAPHAMLPCEMVFVPRDESEVLTLWYKCGSSSTTGGGQPGQRGPQRQVLYMEDCDIRLHVFDDPEHHWARNYQRLHALGAVGFPAQTNNSVNGHSWGNDADAEDDDDEGPRPPRDNFFPKMLLRVCQSLRRQLQASKIIGSSTPPTPDVELVEFMNEYSIPVTDISLRSVEEMVKASMEERNAFDRAQRLAREAYNRARQEHQQQRRRNARGGGGTFAFENGEGVVFGGAMGDLPEGLLQNIFGGGGAAHGGGGGGGGGRDGVFVNAQPMPIPDGFGAAMQDFIGHMMGAVGLDDDDDEEEDDEDEDEEEEDDDEDVVIPVDFVDDEEEEEVDSTDDEAIIVD